MPASHDVPHYLLVRIGFWYAGSMKKAKRTVRPVVGGNAAYAAAAQALRFGNAAGTHRQRRPRGAVKRRAIVESRAL